MERKYPVKVTLRDQKALMAVSPVVLSAYARAAGWARAEPYGEHSDVYAHEGLPEIIVPRTQHLGDYVHVVAQLIGIFAQVANMDELSLYHDLVTADRDVIRVQVDRADSGTVAINDGIDLVNGARDMLLAAACSLQAPGPLYRTGANREANEFLQRVHWGQPEQGSIALTLLLPVVPPPVQAPLDTDRASDRDPMERRVTRRLADALAATRQATEGTVRGDSDAFYQAVTHGASANLCEALVQLITPFPALEISLVWARTRPVPKVRDTFRFANADAPILREAARSFRDREPKPDVRLFGFVQGRIRDREETDGTIAFRASIEGQPRSVKAVLNQADYYQALQAHRDRSLVILDGDLERFGQRWRMLNPHITGIIRCEDVPDEGE